MSLEEKKEWSYLDHPSNVTLIFHFGKIYFWKDILIKYSGFYENLFTIIKETEIDHSEEKDISEKATRFIFNWMNHNRSGIDDELWREILVLSNKWQIKELREIISKFIEGECIDSLEDLKLLCTHQLVTLDIIMGFCDAYDIKQIDRFSKYLCPECIDKLIKYLMRKVKGIEDLIIENYNEPEDSEDSE